jgi:hypothetical protein
VADEETDETEARAAADELIQNPPEDRGFRQRLAEGVAGTGRRVERSGRVELLEASDADRRTLQRELDLIAWQALDYIGGNEQDLKATARRKLVQQARVAWREDAQLGAATELMNDFTLGRGVPKPQAADPKVQEVIDEAWEDEDNQRVLTSYGAQLEMGTDLSLQSNLFFLLFDEGDDGKVKLGLLEHDGVENVVRDPENRLKILYYVTRRKRVKWDFENDRNEIDPALTDDDRIVYFKHWNNEGPSNYKPKGQKKTGEGGVYHVAVNKGQEAAFGHPTMHRVLRWANAFNTMMTARVDLAQAAAAFIMKRKTKGTPNQVQKMAEKALSRRSELARAVNEDDDYELAGPRAGAVITENEQVTHEAFKLDSNAANANIDGQMIRSQISAATHFPQHYLGDIGSANLATATSMELPVLKSVENRQEVIEQIFRWFVDRVIERAIEAGTLDEELTDSEYKDKQDEQAKEQPDEDAGEPPEVAGVAGNGAGAVGAVTEAELGALREAVEAGDIERAREVLELRDEEDPTDLGTPEPERDAEGETPDAPADEEDEEAEDRKRDMGYDFNLPSPLRRTLNDLVNAVSNVARTFDPNGTNVELSRTLLGVALGEGLELTDPGDIVDKVYPPGYVDPAMAALQQSQGGAPGAKPGGPPDFGNTPPPGVQFGGNGGPGEENPYGAPQQSATPEDNPYGPTEAQVQEAEEQAATLNEWVMKQRRQRREDAPEKIGEQFDREIGDPLRKLAQRQPPSDQPPPE